MGLNNNFEIQISALANTSKLVKSIESALKKEFTVNVKANVSSQGIGASTAAKTTRSPSISSAGSTATQLEKASMAADNYFASLRKLKIQGKITDEQFSEFNSSLLHIRKNLSENKSLKQFSLEMGKLKNNVSLTVTENKRFAQELKKSLDPAKRLASSVNELGNKNKLSKKQVAQFNSEIEDLTNKFKNGEVSAEDFAKGLGNISMNIKKSSGGLKEFGRNLLSMIKGFIGFQLAATIIMQTINAIRGLVNEVIELDASMVELNKVTDLTAEQLKKVKDNSFDLARELGRTGKEVIDATTEFARMGYTIEQSTELAKMAVMMTNIAEGIEDTGEAANILTSILKGTNTDIKYANSLLDRLNEISNNNAVSFDALAHMTQEAAATMHILGNNLDETMGLLTGAFAILQDESVANGIQTIGLRIAGLNEDMESVAGLSNEVVTALQKYAGISAFDEQTGQLKSTYAILEELAGVWDKIDKNKQSALLNTLAGKRQADVAAAILQNWEDVEKAVSDASNSMGSAYEENQRAIDSIQGHINQFKNSFQELADTIVSSELIKGIIDIGSALLKVVNWIFEFIGKITESTWALSLFAGVIATLNATHIKNFVLGIIKLIPKIIAWISTTWSAVAANAALQTTLGNFAIGAAVAGIVAGISLISKAQQEQAEAAQKAAEANSDLSETFDDNEESLSEYDKALRKVINHMQEYISILNEYDETESLAERLNLIAKENEDLDNQRELQEKILAVEEARLKLAEARNKKVRVFRAGKGFVYEGDQSEIQGAQSSLTEALNELSSFRYNLLLDRTQEFVDRFNELVSGDQSKFIEGWENLFNEFSDLLDTEFASYIEKALSMVEEFKKIEKELSKDTPTQKPTGNTPTQPINPSHKNQIIGPHTDLGSGLIGGSGIGISKPGIGLLPGYATGTSNYPGGTSIVGENGPELVKLPMGSRIYPTSDTSRMLNNLTKVGGNSNPITVGTVVINEPNNFEGFVNQFCGKLGIPTVDI